MSDHTASGRTPADPAQEAFEAASRRLFESSVDGLDMRVQSRLTQARYAAVEVAANARRRPWSFNIRLWSPVAGVCAAVLGAALWLALPGTHGAGSDQPSLEDLDMVAATEEGSGDPLEMLQNDLDFYDFADKASSSEPATLS